MFDVALSFAATFLAEIGDKTPLLVIALGVSLHRTRVAIAMIAVIAVLQTIAVGLGVGVGAGLEQVLSSDVTTIVAGLVFVGFGVWTWKQSLGTSVLHPTPITLTTSEQCSAQCSAQYDVSQCDASQHRDQHLNATAHFIISTEQARRQEAPSDELPGVPAALAPRNTSTSAASTDARAVPATGAVQPIGVLAAAAGFFVAEIGDKSMFMTAGLAADRHPVAVWVGSFLAMSAVTIITISAARKLVQRFSIRRIQRLSATLMVAVGTASLIAVMI